MKQKTTIIICVALILGIAVWGGNGVSNLSNGNFVLPEPYAQDGVNPFVGKWVNIDPNTSLNTKMAIGIEYGAMTVALWGACSPEDCFWGSIYAKIPWCETERIELTWVFPYLNEFQEIIYMPYDDMLILRSKTFGTDESSSGMCYTTTQYFVRGDFILPL